MEPIKLIGMQYRLGANPVEHGAADCLSLCRTVLAFYGIDTPEPNAAGIDAYGGDTDVFAEELAAWGKELLP